MFRILATLVSVVCVAAVVTLGAAAGYFLATGKLTNEKINAIIDTFNDVGPTIADAPEIPEELAQVAQEQVVNERAMSILGLSARERELNLLKELIEAKTTEVIDEKRELEKARGAFGDELKAAEDQLLTDAAEQARGILLALPAENAVEKLMTLEPREAVLLMKGISEKQHAKILQEFKSKEQTERGNEIFQAIVRGVPSREVIDAALQTAEGRQ